MLVFLDLYGRKLHRCSSTNEPVRKRMRRAGTVASKGDPSLTDRSKVAPLILTKRETEEKQYKMDQQRLAESTKRRLNDWKIVIGVATVPAAPVGITAGVWVPKVCSRCWFCGFVVAKQYVRR